MKLFRLFWIFFKAGSTTFAGGLSMLPLIKRDVIDKYEMMDEKEFYEYITLSQTLPGVIALNAAVFVGKKTAGLPGAIFAGLGAIIPAFFTMLIAAILIQSLPRDNKYVNGFFKGITAASAALILDAAITLRKNIAKGYFAISLALVTFALIIFLRLNTFPVLIAAGVAGIIYYSVKDLKNRDTQPEDVEKSDNSDKGELD